jgi:integrase
VDPGRDQLAHGPERPRIRQRQGTRQTPSNVGRRLKTALKNANPVLEEMGIEPINERVSPHSLRRTYASLRYACGDDPVFVAEQGGWADPAFPIKVYARAVKRREKLTGEYRDAFDAAIEWGRLGTSGENTPARAVEDNQSRTEETAI